MDALSSLPAESAASRIEEPKQYLTFNLSGEIHAIRILEVKEIIEYGELTQIPMAPTFIHGVMNLRGAVVPVVDLAVRFGHSPVEHTRRTCIVILETRNNGERQDIGVVVDAVNEVIEIPDDQIEPPPRFGTHIACEYISGMAKVNGHFVVLLDLEKILSMDDLAQLSDLTQPEFADAA